MATNRLRRRALEDVELTREQWAQHNGLFDEFIPIWGKAFDRGEQADLDYYVTRPSGEGGTQERKTCADIFAAGSEPTAKTTILQGTVGSGKTCFARYLIERVLPTLFPSPLGIRLDVRNALRVQSPEDGLSQAFIRAVEQAVRTGPHRLYAHQREYHADVFRQLGYGDMSSAEIRRASQQLAAREVFEYLLGTDRISHLLIAIDNADDSSREAVQAARSLAVGLAEQASSVRTKPVAVLIPLREYTERYFEIETASHRRLYPVEPARILAAKLREAQDLIEETVREFSHSFTYTLPPRGAGGRWELGSRRITITKASAIDFLVELSKDVFGRQEHEVVALLRQLSNGNKKALTRHAYNLIHSAKLPLTPLFERHFRPGDALESRGADPLIPLSLAIECLMAIHYPFYDVGASHVLNLFNAGDTTTPGDYPNTLVIPRLLCLLVNVGSIAYGTLLAKFDALRYPRLYVGQALEKCLDHGLVTSNHGVDLDDFQERTAIRGLNAARYYVRHLMPNPHYLQYACEDVPMPQEYRVPIQDKYSIGEQHGHVERRIAGIEQLIAFVESEEEREAAALGLSERQARRGFLFEMSVQEGATGKRISELLRQETLPQIDGIRSTRSLAR